MEAENRAVAQLSEQLALKRGYNPRQAKLIKWAAEYHDIGKLLLPQEILCKSSKLTRSEFEQMKLHTVYGVRILSVIRGEVGKIARETALMHHEWYNGQGYLGIKAESLPDFIGIVSVCDVYCALVARRVYKQAWTHEKALHYIVRQSGSQFCPTIVEDFVDMVNGHTQTEGCALTNICI